MELSIIIVNYNTKNLLLKCLNSITSSLKDAKLVYEIIVIDNGSKDGSVQQIKDQSASWQTKNKSHEEKIKIIQNQKNAGFGKANNQGVKIAKGEYLLFLNTDIEVLDDGVWKLFQFIKNNSSVSAAGGKLYNEDQSEQFSCGSFFDLPVVFASLFLKGDKIGLTRYSPVEERKVDWVSGSCLIVRKKDFQELTGFDERIFMYMEEVDLLFRAKKKGYLTYFYPEAKFIHLGAATSKNLTDPILNIYEGFLYFYKKHKSKNELVILKIMLKLKAKISYFIGTISKSSYLTQTYAKAYKLVG